MKPIGDRAREVLDAKGLTLEQIIDFYLLPLPEAKETKFSPWRKVTGKKVEQIIDRRDVAALGTRWFAVDVLFRLRGHYAPKKLGLDPDEGGPVNIYLGGIPRHNVPGSMISRILPAAGGAMTDTMAESWDYTQRNLLLGRVGMRFFDTATYCIPRIHFHRARADGISWSEPNSETRSRTHKPWDEEPDFRVAF